MRQILKLPEKQMKHIVVYRLLEGIFQRDIDQIWSFYNSHNYHLGTSPRDLLENGEEGYLELTEYLWPIYRGLT